MKAKQNRLPKAVDEAIEIYTKLFQVSPEAHG
jgi:hypothetical protein